jgi:hypothetical protein
MGITLEDHSESVNATSAPVAIEPVMILILVVPASVSFEVIRMRLVTSLDLPKSQKDNERTHHQPLQQPLRFNCVTRTCVA